MKIAHVGLASFYTEGMTYQDNQLAEQNVRDGQEVLYISNGAKYENGVVVETGFQDLMTQSGVRLVRLPYVHVLNHFVSDKFRKVKGLYQLLADFAPDVILSHDLSYWSVLDVIRYKQDHPEVKFYADTHTAYYNSGTNWLSLHILHGIFYRRLFQKALPYLEKYFYVGTSEKEFSREVYGIPESLMELYPLGGTLFSPDVYEEKRTRRRAELGLAPEELLLVHTGKLDAPKRTAELLRAFAAVPDLEAKLAVIGSIPAEMEDTLKPLLAGDSRVVYLGWRSSEDLLEYLCAADLYCQPGSVSATMQNALCCGCPVLSFPHASYVDDLDCGEFFWARTQADMEAVFSGLAAAPERLRPMTEGAWRCAREVLDYRKLAARLYQ